MGRLFCDIEGNLHEIFYLFAGSHTGPLKRRQTRGNVYKLTSAWIRRGSEIRQRSLELLQVRWAIEKFANTMRRIEGYALWTLMYLMSLKDRTGDLSSDEYWWFRLPARCMVSVVSITLVVTATRMGRIATTTHREGGAVLKNIRVWLSSKTCKD